MDVAEKGRVRCGVYKLDRLPQISENRQKSQFERRPFRRPGQCAKRFGRRPIVVMQANGAYVLSGSV